MHQNVIDLILFRVKCTHAYYIYTIYTLVQIKRVKCCVCSTIPLFLSLSFHLQLNPMILAMCIFACVHFCSETAVVLLC